MNWATYGCAAINLDKVACIEKTTSNTGKYALIYHWGTNGSVTIGFENLEERDEEYKQLIIRMRPRESR